MKHLLPRETTHSALGETIHVWGTIEIDDDGLEATIHSKVDGHRKETDCFFGKTFKELEADMGSSNYPFDALMEKVRSLRYWPRLKKRIERDEAELDERREKEKKDKSKRGEESTIQGRIVAQNSDGSIKLGNRQFWSSAFARKTVLLKDGKEISTRLGSGPIEEVVFNSTRNTFVGILHTREGRYKFEIEAKTAKLIRRDPLQ
ncbi:hypothetical protein N8697_00945 [bacterium]|nr:hypothetical protein [bacterium]